MKPKRIILVRHGESEGNVDKNIYTRKPDYALTLTDKGKQQALAAGQEIKKLVGDEKARFYLSPLWRARQTFQQINESFNVPLGTIIEDPRLREQEWSGGLRKEPDNEKIEKERDAFGSFYYRVEGGENCADVFDRVSDFLNTLHRDFAKSYFPENAVIVNHGMTMRLFIMRWFHYTVEQFERIANPHNGELWVMEKDSTSDRYRLVTNIREYETVSHPYQFNWSK